ncbi:hypothetical protein F891_03012 [Acinetobacter sp. CIP 101966]|nr:hypothetical protein F891_03012 [Acinetobacter sp. CIP 101966]
MNISSLFILERAKNVIKNYALFFSTNFNHYKNRIKMGQIVNDYV